MTLRGHALGPAAGLQITWVVADDERVALGGRLDGTHLGPWRGLPPTGRRFDVAATVLLTVAGGSVVAVQTLTDSLAMAEQLGAVEPIAPPACHHFRPAG